MHIENIPTARQSAVGAPSRALEGARSDLIVEAAVKRYGATVALDGADFGAASGEVHGLLGENGAGKSTLIKILSGAVSPDSGRIELFGREVRFRRPIDAQRAGVRTVFQELSLVPDLTVAENLVFSGAAPRLAFFGALVGFADTRSRFSTAWESRVSSPTHSQAISRSSTDNDSKSRRP